MTNSTAPDATGKPQKPHEGFPLFAHGSGQWAKKIRGRLLYFGGWKDDRKGIEALKRFNREWPYLKDGRTPPPADVGSGCTMRVLCNAFLASKRAKLEAGDLSPTSYQDYFRTCRRLVEHFGKHRRVDDLRPSDFESLRASMVGNGWGNVTLKNEINRTRIVLRYASDNAMIERPIVFGQAFSRPSQRALRRDRNQAGPKLFTREELQRILKEADVFMRAMVLLGINGGLGNTDVAGLRQSAICWEKRFLDYPRPKTEIQRRIPLWHVTVDALRAAIEARPKPNDLRNEGLVFVTRNRNPWVRVEPKQGEGEGYVRRDTVGDAFGRLLRELGINGRKRLGFYTCRHVFETVAGESRDQVAVDAIMGHVDATMAGQYRQGISDGRLRDVVGVVHQWLFECGDEQAAVVL